MEMQENELVILDEGREDTEELYACCTGSNARQ